MLILVAFGCFDSYKIDYSKGNVSDLSRGSSKKGRDRFSSRMAFWLGGLHHRYKLTA
jgi:hypothetical protein